MILLTVYHNAGILITALEVNMQVVGYLRVSTDEQADHGVSLDAQREQLRAWATTHGHELVGIFEDAGVSGAKELEQRPGLVAAVSAVPRGGVLVVVKRDRLARDPIISAMVERLLARRDGRVVSLAGEGSDGDDPTSILMRRIVDAFAEYERLLIGARTKAALSHKRDRGEVAGQVPFGYRRHGDRIVEDPEAQHAVRLILDLRGQGWTYRAIGDELEARGIRTAKGSTRWNPKTVQRIATRAAA